MSIPVCKCGQICLSKEAYRGENRGRWYWKCALSRCRFFEWNDPGPHLYQPIVFTAPPSTTITSTQNRANDLELRDPSALQIDDSFHPLGSKKSRLSSMQRTKRNRHSESNTTNKPTIQLSLYSNTDISVRASERHRYIQTLFRTVGGIEWDERNHMWIFSADQETYQYVWKLLYQHRATFEVIGIPLAILGYLPDSPEKVIAAATKPPKPTKATTSTTTATNKATPIDNTNSSDYEFDSEGDDDIIDDGISELPVSWFQREIVRGSHLWQALNRTQRDAVKKGVTLEGNIYLHDTIGSGRSLQALGMALVCQNDWPVVIVCRKSVCQTWKTLIQSMLQLDDRDICLLDFVPSYGGKKIYSNSREAIRSRLYRQKRREHIQQHQSRQNLPSTSSTDQRNVDDGKDSWCVSLVNDGGDGSSYFAGWTEPDEPTSSNGAIFSKDATTLIAEEQPNLYISLENDSGDVYSNDDDDLYDGGCENNLYNLDPSHNNDAGETIEPMDTSPTLAENDDDDDDKHVANYNQAIFGTAQFFIISYDKAKLRLSTLGAEKFKIAIFDDCHDIKTTMLPTYRSGLQKFVRGTKKTIMVSSIPIIPRPMETFTLLQIMKPNLFVDYKYFGLRYCDAKHLVFGWDYTGTSNEFELSYLLTRTVLVP